MIEPNDNELPGHTNAANGRTGSTRASQRFGTLPAFEVVWSGDFVADERLGLNCGKRRAYSELARLRDQFTGRKRPKDSVRHQPENQNKTQNIAMKTPKITARS
jgi:hypothetical protein